MDNNMITIVSVLSTGLVSILSIGLPVVLDWRKQHHDRVIAKEKFYLDNRFNSYTNLIKAYAEYKRTRDSLALSGLYECAYIAYAVSSGKLSECLALVLSCLYSNSTVGTALSMDFEKAMDTFIHELNSDYNSNIKEHK